jgi:hypothetical protein
MTYGSRMRQALLFPLALIALLAACREEPTVGERFNAITADVENKGRNYEAEAENLVAEQERRLANEGEAAFQQVQNGLGDAAEVDVNSGTVDVNMR